MTEDNKSKKKKEKPTCSFCGKTEKEVNRLINSKIESVYICDECIKTSKEMIDI